MMKNKTSKSIYIMLFAFSMMLTCLSSGFINIHAENANNTTTESAQQIVHEKDTATVETDNVSFSKTISGTDTENVFDITLDVETKEDLSTIQTSPDAATVLVLDVSGSMAWKENADAKSTRYESMKKAAIAFIDGYANVSANSDGSKASRWICIITFASDANRQLNWVNVATNEGKARALALLDGKDGEIPGPDGGTNIEGGLQLAYNNLNNFKNTTGKELCDNTNVILLTDGCPTFVIDGKKTSLTALQGEEAGKINAEMKAWMNVGGSIYTEYDDDGNPAKGAKKYDSTSINPIADSIKAKANLFTIAFATSSSWFEYKEGKDSWAQLNPHYWMKSFATRALMAGDEEELLEEFETINTIIKLSAQAWIVNDPMASHIMMDTKTIDPTNKNATTFNDNELVWNLKASDCTLTTKEDSTIYHYQLQYRIALDTTTEGSYDYVPTNETTTLKYFLASQIGDEDPNELLKSVSIFNEGMNPSGKNPIVPAIKANFGCLEFIKLDENERPLPGVTFTLNGTATGSNKAVTLSSISNTNGTVTFAKIPAGTYTLTETTPIGREGAGPWTITVSYGKTTVSDKDGKPVALAKVFNYPETQSITVNKTWTQLTSEELALIPDAVVVTILQNGNEYRDITLTKENQWSLTINDLPWGDANHQKYAYTVKEKTSLQGYETSVNDFAVTNRYLGSPMTIEGTKTWSNPNDVHPTITITLQQSLDGEQWVDIMETELDNGKSTYQFDNIKKYAPNGEEYQYRVRETTVDGYDATYDDFHIFNEYVPGNTSVNVTKIWDVKDASELPSVTIKLLQNGEEYRTITLNESTGWSSSFTDLPEIAPNGEKYNYTVTETPITGYTASYLGNAKDGYTITNTFDSSTIEVNGTKTWSNPSTTHPSITVNLYQNGEVIDNRVLKNGESDYSFTNLPKYNKNGSEYQYTIGEEQVDGYQTKVEGNNIYNVYTPDQTSVKVTKIWSNPEATHPTITIHLLQNGTTIATQQLPSGVTSYEFENLDKYAPDGSQYQYMVREDAVNGYTSKVDGYTITNTYTGGEQKTISGTKTWKEVPSGTKVPEITILLKQNGTVYKEIKLTDGKTDYEFENLPTYAEDGTEYVYTIEEVGVHGYTSKVKDYDVINTYTGGEKVTVFGTKTWVAPEGIKVPEVTIHLLQNGKKVDSIVLKDGNTSYEFKDLPMYAPDSTRYQYSVNEDPVNGYSCEVDGYNITNTYTGGEKITVSGTKTWKKVGKNDKVPIITIRLTQNGKEMDSIELEGTTEYAFKNLPTYAPDGSKYVYDVSEDPVNGYESQKEGYNFTNTKVDEVLGESQTPETGDSNHVGFLVAMMALAGAVIVVRKRA